MSLISESTIQELTARADIVSVVSEYVRLEKKGERYWGCCPFHTEKTPSFTVNPDKNFFYCFGCNKGGGSISFVMELEKLSYPEAIEQLAKKFGVSIQYAEGQVPQKNDGEAERQKQLGELYQRVAGSFHHLLLKSPQGRFARDYLTARGVSPAMVERFKLGYSVADRQWLHRFLRSKGYSVDFLEASGLFSRTNSTSAFFADRLMFPIADRHGAIIAFGARLLHGEGPKYLNSSESAIFKKGTTLFALNLALEEIRRTKTVYICEGYMDVIAMHQAGIVNAVAPLGTSFTEQQIALLKRWCESLNLVFDADSAGQNAAVKAILNCRRQGVPCSVVRIQGGKDPADILKDQGPEALQINAKYSINDFDYLLERARNGFTLGDGEGKARAVASLFPYLELLDAEVSRDECINKIADALGVEKSSVIRDFNQRSQPGFTRRETEVHPAGTVKPVRMNEELFLLACVVANRDLYKVLRAELAPADMEDSKARELFIALEECFREEAGDLDSILARIGDDGLRMFLLEQMATAAYSMNSAQLVHDGIQRLRCKKLEQRRSELLLKTRMIQGVQTPGKDLDDLLAEIMQIDAELARLKDVHS